MSKRESILASIGSELAGDVGPGAVPPQKIQAVPTEHAETPSAEGRADVQAELRALRAQLRAARPDWRSLPHSTPLPGTRTVICSNGSGSRDCGTDGR